MVFKKLFSSTFSRELLLSGLTFVSYTMVGVCRGYTSFIITQLREPNSEIHLSPDEESWLASLTILPDPFGCFIGGILLDIVGRKLSLVFIYIPFITAWLIISFATNAWMLYLGTTFNGIASGMTFCSATYIAEMCRPKNRGFLLTTMGPTFSVGVLFCNIIVYWFKWKFAAMVFVCLSVVCLLAFYILLPESPMYLIGKNRKDEAIRVLTWMRGRNVDVDKEVIEVENYCRSMRKNERKSLTGTMKDCLHSWKPQLILVVLNFIQQGTGYQIIVAYTTVFFDELRIPFDTSLAVIIYSSVVLITSFLVPPVTQRFGRRTLLAASGLGMGVAFFVTSVYETLFYEQDEKPVFWIVLLSVYAYAISLTLGVMLMPFIMGSELFKVEVRGIMAGVNGALQYIIVGGILKVFPLYLYTVGITATLWTFTLFSLSNILFAKFVLPETRGKTLKQIQDEYFSDKSEEFITEHL